MRQLKTQCSHCNKGLAPNEWSIEEWKIFCSDKCRHEEEKKIREEFEKQFMKK